MATMRSLLLLILMGIKETELVIHSLRYFYTASSGLPNFPSYVSVGLVDDVQISCCDSIINRNVPKQEWMNNVSSENPHYWEEETLTCLAKQETFKENIEIAILRFNQTGGVHAYQHMYGCDWDDETGEVKGYDQMGYDGEDFIALDLNTLSWIAAKPEAVLSKHNWDKNEYALKYEKLYFNKLCVDWLKKYVSYGRSSLMKAVLPSVSLLQKSSSSVVSCHAAGFYPNRAEMFWRKHGEEIHKRVNKGEILPNNDGTFQMSADIDLRNVALDYWRNYECVFHLSGAKNDIINRLKTEIKTNRVIPDIIIILIIVVILAVMLFAVIGFLYNRNKTRRPPSLTHSLQYFYTGSSGIPDFPAYVSVGYVDNIQISHCDSRTNRNVPKQEWMNYSELGPDYWERQTEECVANQMIIKFNIETAKQRFNHTEGVHIYQTMYGCEWDDETDHINGYEQYGYDGEDFIVFDLNTGTWLTTKPQGVINKHEWDNDRGMVEQTKGYLTQICPG